MKSEEVNEPKWAEAVATVRFDLEEGQVVDFVFPKDKFSPATIKQLGYMSFPDSYAFAPEGELFYSFLVENQGEPLSCYSYFTQRRDPSNPRGYFQKSIVLVSKLRITRIFKVILRQLHRLYFEGEMDEMIAQRCLISLNANVPPSALISAEDTFIVNMLEHPLKVLSNRVRDKMHRFPDGLQLVR